MIWKFYFSKELTKKSNNIWTYKVNNNVVQATYIEKDGKKLHGQINYDDKLIGELDTEKNPEVTIKFVSIS